MRFLVVVVVVVVVKKDGLWSIGMVDTTKFSGQWYVAKIVVLFCTVLLVARWFRSLRRHWRRRHSAFLQRAGFFDELESGLQSCFGLFGFLGFGFIVAEFAEGGPFFAETLLFVVFPGYWL